MLITGDSARLHEFGGFEFRSLAVPSRGSAEIALWTVDVPEGGDGTPHRASKEEVFYVLSGSVTIQGRRPAPATRSSCRRTPSCR
ncbi:hypothetical protein SAMN04488000_10193 [Lentzea albida]|uniref:Cupin domain-containing protein n=1 Tax=Lentzea albida TaxID=65499 RepID=A0A1H9ABH5_9PSEU|nr:hypothetical protein SAMN04488000_10193 [Lentzea albida]